VLSPPELPRSLPASHVVECVGYGDPDTVTLTLPRSNSGSDVITTYFRKSFTVTKASGKK
jgi:hypothetical protein